jgi:hypothetical protein
MKVAAFCKEDFIDATIKKIDGDKIDVVWAMGGEATLDRGIVAPIQELDADPKPGEDLLYRGFVGTDGETSWWEGRVISVHGASLTIMTMTGKAAAILRKDATRPGPAKARLKADLDAAIRYRQ